MDLKEKINFLIETRRTEAAEKHIIKKCTAVLQALGRDIVSQIEGGALFDNEYAEIPFFNFTQAPKFYEGETYTDEMPTFDGDVRVMGRYFDGLSSGINMQINYNESHKSLKITYNGNVVFRQTSGTIDCYVPLAEWESKLDSLSVVSMRKINKIKQEAQDDGKKEAEDKKALDKVKDYLKKIWGV